MINPPSVQQKCAVFSRKDTGDETRLFPLRRTDGNRLSETPRGLEKKRPAGRPRVRESSRMNPRRERRTDEAQSTVFLRRRLGRRRGRKNSGPRRRMRLSAHGRARKPAGHLSPQCGRNQKNGRRLRSGMMKKDARFSNKKAARPHEDSARTSRLTGKAVSDRS